MRKWIYVGIYITYQIFIMSPNMLREVTHVLHCYTTVIANITSFYLRFRKSDQVSFAQMNLESPQSAKFLITHITMSILQIVLQFQRQIWSTDLPKIFLVKIFDAFFKEFIQNVDVIYGFIGIYAWAGFNIISNGVQFISEEYVIYGWCICARCHAFDVCINCNV